MTVTNLVVPTFTHALTAMGGWLEKATAHAASTGDDDAAVLSRRLAPDMFPLASQIRFACVHAEETITRLRNEATTAEVQVVRDEALRGREQPGTMGGARARIEEALSSLARVGADGLDASAGSRVGFTMPSGMAFELRGEDYVRDWALPQFYFHVNTTYAILRAYGTRLGKADYIGHMKVHLTSG